MPDFWLTGWKLSDFTGPLTTDPTATVGDPFVNTSVTLAADAEMVSLQVTDDDDILQDAYIETGDLSVLTNDLVLDGVTYPATSTNIEVEFQLATNDAPPITFYIGRLGTGTSNSGENLLVFTDQPLTPGTTYTFASPADGPEIEFSTICFTAGTQIITPEGPVDVEDLCPGDKVLTRDAGAQRVHWVGHRHVTARELARHPKLSPVRIAAGALGNGMPRADLVVSRQHRILIDDWRASHLFGEAEVLAPSVGLLNLKGVTVDPAPEGVHYVHILLETHELVLANGAWAETLLTGAEARSVMGHEQVEEMDLLFPGLMDRAGDPICPMIKTAEARALH